MRPAPPPPLCLLLLVLAACPLCLLPGALAQADGPQNYSPCLIAWEGRSPRTRPIVTVAKNTQYKALLSLDGGDVRATITVAVLCEVESTIKRQLIALGRVSYTNIDQFDILLSDYFDVIAGTSAGSYLSTYIGTSGGNVNAMRNVGVTTTLPGSSYGAFQFMKAFQAMIADATATVPGGSSEYTVVGPWLYNYFDNWFSALYNNISTLYGHNTKKASMLWTWTRASAGGGVTAMSMFKHNQAEKGGLFFSNLDGTTETVTDRDYYVWQGIRGTTSWPPRVPTYIATTTPNSPVKDTYAVIDGAITAMDPTAAAWPWMQVHMQATAKRTAILSIGTGQVMDLSYADKTDADWIGYNLDYNRAWVASLSTRFHSASTFKAVFGTYAEDQYVRIDQDFYTGPDGDDCGGVFVGAECTLVRTAVASTQAVYLPTYTRIGAKWAQVYSAQIDQFVKKFLLDGSD